MPLPFPLADLAMESTTTEGTGALFLDPDPPHTTLLAAVGAATTAWFVVYQDATAWEVFSGQVTDGGAGKDSVSRAGFIASSTGSTVNFGEGVKMVRLTVPAREVLARGRALQEILDGGFAATAQTNLGGTTTGKALFTAASAAAARTAIGATTIGGNVLTAADAAAVRTLLGLLTAALRNVGVASGTEIPDRAAGDARYAAIATAGRAYVDFPTDGSVKVPFYVATAPTKWTRVTTGVNECVIRLVTTGGGDAFTDPPRTDVANGTTADHVLTVAQMPAHLHNVLVWSGSGTASNRKPLQTTATGGESGNSTTGASESQGSGAGHSHVIQLKHANFLLASFTG